MWYNTEELGHAEDVAFELWMHGQFGEHKRSQELLKASLRAINWTHSFLSALQTTEHVHNLIGKIKSVYMS